jgi:hypothetical protein
VKSFDEKLLAAVSAKMDHGCEAEVVAMDCAALREAIPVATGSAERLVGRMKELASRTEDPDECVFLRGEIRQLQRDVEALKDGGSPDFEVRRALCSVASELVAFEAYGFPEAVM